MSSNYENCSFVHYAIFGSGELKVESKGKSCQIAFHFLRINFLIIEVGKVHIIGALMRKIVIDKKHSPKFNVRLAGCVNYLSVELKVALHSENTSEHAYWVYMDLRNTNLNQAALLHLLIFLF